MLDVFNDNHDIMVESFINLDTPLLHDTTIIYESMPIDKTKKHIYKKLIMTISQSTFRPQTIRPMSLLFILANW